MEPVRIFGGTSGVNNIVDPVRLRTNGDTGLSELAEAVNVLIDQAGMPYRRPGQSLISAGNFHSLFCDGGDCFVVLDIPEYSTIYKLGTDKVLTSVQPGLATSRRYGWQQVGAKTYWSNGVQKGVIVGGVSQDWSAQTYAGPPTTRNFSGPPVGTRLALYASRMFVVNGRIVSKSEPLGYGLYDRARMRLRFSSDVKLFKPVAGGVFASDSKRTYFLEGNPDDFLRTKILDCPAHEYSEAAGYIDGKEFGLQDAGLCAVWSCDEGLCIGTSTGQLFVITENKLAYPSGTTGASLIYDSTIINTVDADKCVATNLIGSASSHLTGFEFNSFANFNGSWFAAGATGLYELTGDTDNGSVISAHITTGATDMGAHQTKPLCYVYLGISTAGKVKVTTTADKQNGETIVITPKKTGAQRVCSRRCDRRIKGRYWSFRVENVLGADLSIYEIEALPVVLHSGRY